jgi:hypothetical protein
MDLLQSVAGATMLSIGTPKSNLKSSSRFLKRSSRNDPRNPVRQATSVKGHAYPAGNRNQNGSREKHFNLTLYRVATFPGVVTACASLGQESVSKYILEGEVSGIADGTNSSI